MKNLSFVFLIMISYSLVFTSCFMDNRSDTEKAIDKAGEDLKEGLKDMEEDIKEATEDVEDNLKNALENLGNALKDKDGETVETISFRKLKKYMPRKMAGLPQTDTSGETNGVGSIKVSTAKGEYEKGDQKMEISITDVGGVGGAFMSAAAWTGLEIDKESKDKVEYTGKYEGHKTYVKYNKKRESGEYSLFVAKRFIVQIKGENISLDDLEEAVDDFDFDDLEDLADE